MFDREDICKKLFVNLDHVNRNKIRYLFQITIEDLDQVCNLNKDISNYSTKESLIYCKF